MPIDPMTIAMGVTAVSDLIQTLNQYNKGAITQEQAHQQFLGAHVSLLSAVLQFQQAGVKPAA